MRVSNSGNIPYSQRRKDAIVAGIPQLLTTGTDAYVAAATAFPGLNGLGSPETGGQFRFMSGGLALWHGIQGIRQLKDQPTDLVEKRAAQTAAIGEFISAAGFVGLAAGMGHWALPLVAIGGLTTNFARFS